MKAKNKVREGNSARKDKGSQVKGEEEEQDEYRTSQYISEDGNTTKVQEGIQLCHLDELQWAALCEQGKFLHTDRTSLYFYIQKEEKVKQTEDSHSKLRTLSFRYWHHQKIFIKRYLLSYLSACNICYQIGTTESRWHKILSKNVCIIKVHHLNIWLLITTIT